MPEAETWIIIVKFKRPQPAPKRPFNPFLVPRLRDMRRDHDGIEKLQIENMQTIPLDKPIIILPNGTAEKIEVFPITDTTLIHSKNFKRVVR